MTAGGHARVGFGGMHPWERTREHLVFVRIREVLPEDQLRPPAATRCVWTLSSLATVSVDGRVPSGTVDSPR